MTSRRLDLPLGHGAAGRFLPWTIGALLYLAVVALAVTGVANEALRLYGMRTKLVTVTLPAVEDAGPGERQMAAVTLYASLFTPDVKRIDLHGLPKSHQAGPDFLNVQRYLDLPQALALAAERSPVRVYQDAANWTYPQGVAKALTWDAKQLVFRGK